MRLQKEKKIVVDPLSLKIPSFRQTRQFEITSSQGMIPASNLPSSAISTPQGQELPSKVSNFSNKNHLMQKRNQGKTNAAPVEFNARMSEHDNKNLERTKGPKGNGFKCCSFGMCLPGFAKAKAVKARKRGTVMDHSVNDPVNVMSSTFSISFETFEFNSGVTQGAIVRENNEDDSISSYFELPSAMF